MNINEFMNGWIRGRSTFDPPIQAIISDEQEDRILKYMAAGASYGEASGLVLSLAESVGTIPGNAGSGLTGDPSSLSASRKMNLLIRRSAGLIR